MKRVFGVPAQYEIQQQPDGSFVVKVEVVDCFNESPLQDLGIRKLTAEELETVIEEGLASWSQGDEVSD